MKEITEGARSPIENRITDTYNKFLKARDEADRFAETEPPRGSYRGTFREVGTHPEIYKASMIKEVAYELWQKEMRRKQQEAQGYADELRQSASFWFTPAQKRKWGKKAEYMSPEDAFTFVAVGASPNAVS